MSLAHGHCFISQGSNYLRLEFTWGFWNMNIPGYIIPTIYLTGTVRVPRRCGGLDLKIFTNVRQDVISLKSGVPTTVALPPKAPPHSSAPSDYASLCVVDCVSIRDWLLRHFVNACGVLADAIEEARDFQNYPRAPVSQKGIRNYRALGKYIWTVHGVWVGPDAIESSAAKKQEIPMLEPDRSESPSFDPSRHVVLLPTTDALIAHPEPVFFLQLPVFVQPPLLDGEDFCGRGLYSAYYYDGLTLMTRHWNWFNVDALDSLRGEYSLVLGALRVGERAIRNCLCEQLGMLKPDALDIIGPAYLTLIGEIGVPFDLDSKHNSPVWGDGWNLENLSLWSSDDADWDRGAGNGFMVESLKAHLLGRERRDDATSLSVLEAAEIWNRSESTLGTLRGDTLRMGVVTIDTQPPPRPESTVTRPTACASPLLQALRFARGGVAIACPWPIATVSLSSNLDVEIASARFELNIKVRDTDRVWGEAIRPGAQAKKTGTRTGTLMSLAGGDSTQYQDTEDDDTLVAHSRSESKAAGELTVDGKLGHRLRRGTTATLRRARANTISAPWLLSSLSPLHLLPQLTLCLRNLRSQSARRA
ncbi:hypothetical protein BDV93DRAFT_515644 [Ceratobasidium sp. AG-I]|nr:hypothetical protein BDV93DRAFT_515644 [Ceratobasidium sp. AG-I]